MKCDFWKSAGMHLLTRDDSGWLQVTPDFIRAYLTRPEIHPVEESCAAEVALHEALLESPAMPVSQAQLAKIADGDVADNYRVFVSFRDHLLAAGTIEGAYLRLVRRPVGRVPLMFIDQLAHLIMRNILKDVEDPMRLRAAELFFREQKVSTDDGRLLLADEEIVDMHARGLNNTGLGQLLAQTGTPQKQVTLDVLSENNADIYWQRSDRFDTVIDLRFEQPALDAFARVIEAWLDHMLRLEVRVEPRPKLDDDDWRWHIGLDQQSNLILNELFEGKTPPAGAMERIIALFRMRILDDRLVIDRVKGRPVYLALAMSEDGRCRMKPQNLLANLPLAAGS
ncbi:MAG TPA: DUF6352 family protein [Hyphomicrobiaceae bacterium]|nr:DUF6352 family protein [Hyphomicrobiaceae bacterium]